MANFEESNWANSEFSKNYIEEADVFLPFRGEFVEIAKSFYGHFVSQNTKAKVLDLGCGDGFFINELLKSYTPSEITLVDGSEEMLSAAKKRFEKHPSISFIKASFQELTTNDKINQNQKFDFIYSSLAIHHLTFEEKKTLYSYIYNHLSPGGYFLNYDSVLSSSEELEEWYFLLWEQWIKKYSGQEKHKEFLKIHDRYKDNNDDIPDTLDSQLAVLKEIGFKNVDFYFKYGIFALFGGSK